MGSTRFPGKVLADLDGRPMLAFMLERLAALRVDSLVVATSNKPKDDALIQVATGAGVPVVRGSELDVLDRFLTAVDAYPGHTIVRLTADCPFSDPLIIERALEVHTQRDADYTSNTLIRTY